MIVRYWNPLQEIDTVNRQMDTLLHHNTAKKLIRHTTWSPAVRLIDLGDVYQLTVQLSDVEAGDVDIQASRESIAISGNRHPAEEAKEAKVLYEDIRYGSFRRVVYLPEAIQNQAVTADFSHGLLTLSLPKLVKAANKVVKVDLNALQAADDTAAAAQPEAVVNSETEDVWAAQA